MTDLTPAGRARALAERHGAGLPPFSATDLAEAEGIAVRVRDYPADLTDRVAAEIDMAARTITVNRALPAGLRNAAIGHELAHMLMHGAYLASGRYVPRARGAFPDPAPACAEDREADEFALALLLPAEVLADMLEESDAAIARSLDVPLTAVREARARLSAGC